VDFCSLTDCEAATMAPNGCNDIGLKKTVPLYAVDPMRTLHHHGR
jgi:hypothetical protein